MEEAVIMYDADCAFCWWSLSKVLAWDRRHILRPVALQSEEAAELLPGWSPADRMRSWHLVMSDGRVLSAGAAVPALARLLPGGRPVAILASTFPRATEWLYRGVSRYRGSLGRVLHATAAADPTRKADQR